MTRHLKNAEIDNDGFQRLVEVLGDLDSIGQCPCDVSLIRHRKRQRDCVFEVTLVDGEMRLYLDISMNTTEAALTEFMARLNNWDNPDYIFAEDPDYLDDEAA